MKALYLKHFWLGGLAYTALMLSFTFIFDFDGLYGQDAYDYLKQCSTLFSAEKESGFWPPLYPFLGNVLSLGFLPLIFSLQLLSILSLVVSGFLLLRILYRLYPEKQYLSLYVTLFFLLAPFVLRSGLLIMSDALAMMMLLMVFNFFFTATGHKRMMGVFLFASFTLLTRYALAPLLVPVLLVLSYECWKEKKIGLFFGAALLFVLPLVFNFLFWSTAAGGLQHAWLQQWSPLNFFRYDFETNEGIQHYILPNFLQVLKVFYHPGFFLPLGLFLIFYRKSDWQSKSSKIILLSLLLYLFFLAGIPYQNDRFLLPMLPLWLLLSYPAFSRMMEAKLFFRGFLVPVAVLISFFMIYRAMQPMVNRNHLEREIVDAMQSYDRQTLYAFDMDIALKGRGLEMNYINLWRNELDTFQSGALVLFNEEQFREQWRGKNPMINYLRMKESGRLIFVRNFSKGWQLSRLQ